MDEYSLSDLDILSRVKLAGEQRPSWKRVAYFAGLVSGLQIAKKFVEGDVKFMDVQLRIHLYDHNHPVLGLSELAHLIYSCTRPHVLIDLNIFQETGLRYGATANYYRAGTENALEVGFDQCEKIFDLISDNPKADWIFWLDEKIEWAMEMLENEKHALK